MYDNVYFKLKTVQLFLFINYFLNIDICGLSNAGQLWVMTILSNTQFFNFIHRTTITIRAVVGYEDHINFFKY